jgi:hypothetical protein
LPKKRIISGLFNIRNRQKNPLTSNFLGNFLSIIFSALKRKNIFKDFPSFFFVECVGEKEKKKLCQRIFLIYFVWHKEPLIYEMNVKLIYFGKFDEIKKVQENFYFFAYK